MPTAHQRLVETDPVSAELPLVVSTRDGRLLPIAQHHCNTFLCVNMVLRLSHLACNSSSNFIITSPSSSTHLLFSDCPVVITTFSSFSLVDTSFSVAYNNCIVTKVIVLLE